jgi:hypothetical protein
MTVSDAKPFHAITFQSRPPPEPERPWWPVIWYAELWGVYTCERPPVGAVALSNGRWAQLQRFRIRQYRPFPTPVAVAGVVRPDGQVAWDWLVKPGHQATQEEQTRALMGLDLLLDRHRRNDVLEPEEVLGRLKKALELARSDAENWWSLRVALKRVPLGRTSVYRYLARFGWWSWRDLREQLAPKTRRKSGTKPSAPVRHA